MLGIWVFDNDTIGAFEVIVPFDGSTTSDFAADTTKSLRRGPTHVCHRLLKEGYDVDLYGDQYTISLQWRNLETLREEAVPATY